MTNVISNKIELLKWFFPGIFYKAALVDYIWQILVTISMIILRFLGEFNTKCFINNINVLRGPRQYMLGKPTYKYPTFLLP